MKITWLGHAFFKIVLDNGKVILFDPFDDQCGYDVKTIEADYVFSSHDHHDHNCLKYIIGDYTLINQPGEYTYPDLSVKGFSTFHDHSGGKARGLNTVYKICAEGVTLVHLGDIGEVPGEQFIKTIGEVDVLFIPVGGVYTINAEEAKEVVETISPNIIIPMHYQTEHVNTNLLPVSDFLNLINGIYDYSILGKCELEVSSKSLKKRTRVIIMEYN